MNGAPVWLASVSLREKGRIVPTGRWSKSQRRHAESALFEVLGGHQVGTCLGDPGVQRCFRMNVTLCIHRRVTAQEREALLPANIVTSNLAGGPIEILWEEGCTTEPSCLPCEQPIHQFVGPNPELWVPKDCGRCAPCLARRAIELEPSN